MTVHRQDYHIPGHSLPRRTYKSFFISDRWSELGQHGISYISARSNSFPVSTSLQVLNTQSTSPTLRQPNPTNKQMTSKVARKIVQSVLSREQAEGAGARVRRSIGTRSLRNLDPFLMLDEFSVQAPAGFPE
jgi:hypothetical protein